jgi:hypothetical protein
LFILNKSNHGSIAKGIKLVIIVSLDVFDDLRSLFKELVAYVLFESISIVCDESLSVVKLNFEGLVVEWHPSATRGTSALILLITLLSFNCKIFLQVHFPDCLGGER